MIFASFSDTKVCQSVLKSTKRREWIDSRMKAYLPLNLFLGFPTSYSEPFLSIFHYYHQLKKMYEVNRYQVEDDSLYVYESIWQFLKRSVWQMVSTWNKLSLIQKYKPKRTSWDEIRMKANRQSSTVSALGILKLILKPFLSDPSPIIGNACQ